MRQEVLVESMVCVVVLVLVAWVHFAVMAGDSLKE
jgi:hypothetical protein